MDILKGWRMLEESQKDRSVLEREHVFKTAVVSNACPGARRGGRRLGAGGGGGGARGQDNLGVLKSAVEAGD